MIVVRGECFRILKKKAKDSLSIRADIALPLIVMKSLLSAGSVMVLLGALPVVARLPRPAVAPGTEVAPSRPREVCYQRPPTDPRDLQRAAESLERLDRIMDEAIRFHLLDPRDQAAVSAYRDAAAVKLHVVSNASGRGRTVAAVTFVARQRVSTGERWIGEIIPFIDEGTEWGNAPTRAVLEILRADGVAARAGESGPVRDADGALEFLADPLYVGGAGAVGDARPTLEPAPAASPSWRSLPVLLAGNAGVLALALGLWRWRSSRTPRRGPLGKAARPKRRRGG